MNATISIPLTGWIKERQLRKEDKLLVASIDSYATKNRLYVEPFDPIFEANELLKKAQALEKDVESYARQLQDYRRVN